MSASVSAILAWSAVVTQHLQRGRRAARVEVVTALEFARHEVDQPVVPIDAAQVNVAVGGQDLEVAGRVAHHGDVERAAPQVVDQRQARVVVAGAQLALAPGVGQRGRGRLVDDVDHVQARDSPGVFSGLAPRVVEIIGHRDHGVADLADALLGVLAELFEDQTREEFGRDFAAVEGALVLDVAHEPLDAVDDVFGIFHGRPGAAGPDDDVAAFGQQDQAGRFDFVVLVGNRHRIAFLVELREGGERRAQIDPDRMAWLEFHELLLSEVPFCDWTAVERIPKAIFRGFRWAG